MKIEQLEQSLIQAFCSLNVSSLYNLDENADYSHNYRDEMIAELQEVFDKIKSNGISSLSIIKANCKCYPTGNAFSFYHPKTNELVIRYVIDQRNDNAYIVEECANNPIPERADGLPF